MQESSARSARNSAGRPRVYDIDVATKRKASAPIRKRAKGARRGRKPERVVLLPTEPSVIGIDKIIAAVEAAIAKRSR
jgi:hypothetical protein